MSPLALIRDPRRHRAPEEQRVARGAVPAGTTRKGPTGGWVERRDGGGGAPRQDPLPRGEARATAGRRAHGLVVAVVLALMTLGAGAQAQEGPCKRHREVFAGMPVKVLTVEAAGKKIALRVKAAETPEQQSTGFQCATPQEIERNLILFDFGREIRSQFHMQNVPAALDIAFIKSDGRIFAILQMEPSPTALYGPMGEFRYALEARKGFFQSQGIAQGEARLTAPGR